MFSNKKSHFGLIGYLHAQFQGLFILKNILFVIIGSTLFLHSQAGKAQTIVVVEDIVLRVSQAETAKVNLKSYPNPAIDKMIVEVENATQIQQIDIFDLSGMKIQSIKPVSMSTSLKVNVSTMPSGSYIMRTKTEKGLVSRKFSVTQ